MTHLAECFAWCMLQVTLFAVATAVVYWLAKRQHSNGKIRLLAIAFGVIAVLTFAFVSPWPHWDLVAPMSKQAPAAFSTLDSVAPANPDLKALTGTGAKIPLDELPKGYFSDRAIAFGSNVEIPRDDLPHQDKLVLHPVDASQQVLSQDLNRKPMDRLLLALVGVAWAAAAWGALRFTVGLVCVIRYRRTSQPIDDETARQEFERLREQIGAPANVELRESPSLTVAATIGWLRPVVMLPSDWGAWNRDERRAVLAHELAHVAQRHFPVWIASQLTTVLHFYHPLVHWLGRRLRLEQEIAADELAANVFGRRDQYAAILAGLALGKPQPAAIVGLGLFMSRPLLMRRIAMLRETPSTPCARSSRVLRVFAFCVLFAVAGIAAGVRSPNLAAAADEKAVEDLFGPGAPRNATTFGGGESDAHKAMDADASPQEGLEMVGAAAESLDDDDVTALIQVSSVPNYPNRATAPPDWKIYCGTQVVLLGSRFVLDAALKDPEIAKLPLIDAQKNPLGWLQSQLEIGFMPGTEIIYVSLKGSREDREQLRLILNAVVRAYMRKVVDQDEQRRSVVRDALSNSLQKLMNEIQQKMDQNNDLSEELGISPSEDARDAESELLLQELNDLRAARRELEQTLTEIQAKAFALRDAFESDDTEKALMKEQQVHASLVQKRIAAIETEIEKKTEQFKRRGGVSVDLSVRRAELEQLQKIANEMSLQLERLGIESILPQRIRVVQWAM